MGKYDQIDCVDYLQHLLDTAEDFQRQCRDRPVQDELVRSMRDDNEREILALRARLDQIRTEAARPDPSPR